MTITWTNDERLVTFTGALTYLVTSVMGYGYFQYSGVWQELARVKIEDNGDVLLSCCEKTRSALAGKTFEPIIQGEKSYLNYFVDPNNDFVMLDGKQEEWVFNSNLTNYRWFIPADPTIKDFLVMERVPSGQLFPKRNCDEDLIKTLNFIHHATSFLDPQEKNFMDLEGVSELYEWYISSKKIIKTVANFNPKIFVQGSAMPSKVWHKEHLYNQEYLVDCLRRAEEDSLKEPVEEPVEPVIKVELLPFKLGDIIPLSMLEDIVYDFPEVTGKVVDDMGFGPEVINATILSMEVTPVEFIIRARRNGMTAFVAEIKAEKAFAELNRRIKVVFE